jgi:hypothetical protein
VGSRQFVRPQKPAALRVATNTTTSDEPEPVLTKGSSLFRGVLFSHTRPVVTSRTQDHALPLVTLPDESSFSNSNPSRPCLALLPCVLCEVVGDELVADGSVARHGFIDGHLQGL